MRLNHYRTTHIDHNRVSAHSFRHFVEVFVDFAAAGDVLEAEAGGLFLAELFWEDLFQVQT